MWNHVKEIRQRFTYLLSSLLLTFITAYYYSFELLFLLVNPFLTYGRDFVFLDLSEAFYTTLSICALTSLLGCIPLLLYQIWCFVIPSCYRKERRVVYFVTALSLSLSLITLCLSYCYLLPLVSAFLLGFQLETEFVTLTIQTRMSSYIGWSLRLLGALFLFSQIPTLLFLLFHWKRLDSYSLSRSRKYIFLLSLLVAALVSPPEVVSQSLIALFLFLSYEFSIWIGFVYLSLNKKSWHPEEESSPSLEFSTNQQTSPFRES